MTTAQPSPPSPPPPPPSPPGDMQIQIGPSGVKVLRAQDAEGTAALATQARLLRDRITTLTKEIEAVKAEISAPGSAPLMSANQLRLTGLEERRNDAEETLQEVEDQLAGIDQGVLTTEVGMPPGFPGNAFETDRSVLESSSTVIALTAIVCVGMPIAIAIARTIWKRATGQAQPSVNPEDARRLERVEQAVDTIAVEMERMSEGQRYVTKLLAERGERVVEPVSTPPR